MKKKINMYETEKDIMNIDNLIFLFKNLSKYDLDCIYFHKYFDLISFCNVEEEAKEEYKEIYLELETLKKSGVKNLIYEENKQHEERSIENVISVDIFNCFNNKNYKPVNIYYEK